MFLDEPLIWLWALLSSNGSLVVYPEATYLPSQGGPGRQGCAVPLLSPPPRKPRVACLKTMDISRGDEERGLGSGLHPMF